jgi:threonine/homoserine/homoserine lactone efflux protein
MLLMGLVVTDVIQLPEGGGLLLLISGIPLVSYVALRSLDQYSPIAFGTVALISTVAGLQLLGGDVLTQVITSLQPVLPVLALAGAYLAYRAIGAARAPDETNTVTLDIDDSNGGDGGP